MTVEDVAFTFWRNILAGGTNSPQWMMVEPIYGAGLSDITEVVDAKANGADLSDPAMAILNGYTDATPYDDREALGAYDAAVLKAVCEDLKTRIVPDEAAGTVTIKLAQCLGAFPRHPRGRRLGRHPEQSLGSCQWRLGWQLRFLDSLLRLDLGRIQRDCPRHKALWAPARICSITGPLVKNWS